MPKSQKDQLKLPWREEEPTWVWAYCGADWEAATIAAAGVPKVMTSPPWGVPEIHGSLEVASHADIAYFNLHGYLREPNWFGQKNGEIGPTALTPEAVRKFDWSDTVIFAEVCFAAKDGGGAIARAFLESGAKAFIGSVTEAYGRARPTLIDGEADRLMWLFRKVYSHIREPNRALDVAKKLLALSSWPLDTDDQLTLDSFVCLTRRSQ